MNTALLLMILFGVVLSYSFLSTEIKLLKTFIMGKFEDLLAKQDSIDASIEEVKKDLDFIKGQLGQNPDGLNAEQVAALEARVDSTLSRLQALDAETDSTTPEA